MTSNHTGDGQPPKGAVEVMQAAGGGLSAMAIRRPVFTTMIMLGLVVMGIFSRLQLCASVKHLLMIFLSRPKLFL